MDLEICTKIAGYCDHHLDQPQWWVWIWQQIKPTEKEQSLIRRLVEVSPPGLPFGEGTPAELVFSGTEYGLLRNDPRLPAIAEQVGSPYTADDIVSLSEKIDETYDYLEQRLYDSDLSINTPL